MSRFPWWGSVLLAILAYCSLKYGVIQLLPAEKRIVALSQLLAPLSAMGFLLLAGKQLYDNDDGGDTNEQEEHDDDTPEYTSKK